jgi:hypothetical protein
LIGGEPESAGPLNGHSPKVCAARGDRTAVGLEINFRAWPMT